jgi:hypothetical protein
MSPTPAQLVHRLYDSASRRSLLMEKLAGDLARLRAAYRQIQEKFAAMQETGAKFKEYLKARACTSDAPAHANPHAAAEYPRADAVQAGLAGRRLERPREEDCKPSLRSDAR